MPILKTMSKMQDRQHLLIFDTVSLSNFAFVHGGILFLKQRYRQRGAITLQVIQEIAKAVYAGYFQIEDIGKTLFTMEGFQKISLTEKEQDSYILLLRNLGEGEASCLACAIQRKAVVVTDDRTARNFCKERNILVTGTIGILKAACLDGILETTQADQMLAQMISNGFYSPIHKISHIL